MEPLDLDSDADYQTPNTSNYPDLTQSGPGSYSISLGDQPWSGLHNMLRNNDLMSDQNQFYAQTPGRKRRKTMAASDSGVATSPSSGFVSPHQARSSQPQRAHVIFSSPTVSAQPDDMSTPYPQERQQNAGSCSGHRDQSPSPSHQSPPRPGLNKYFCDYCTPLPNFTGFGTRNDLERHLKNVHGIVDEGDKIWICGIPGCATADKKWPRRDNFMSHLKRMHFHNNEERARNEVDNFQVSYNSSVHGLMKGGSARGASRSKSIQVSTTSGTAQKRASVPDASMSQHKLMVEMTGQGHIMFNQYPIGMAPATSGTVTPAAFSRGNSGLESSPFLQPHRRDMTGRNMSRPGGAYTAPPNSDNRVRQRREMHELDQAMQLNPRNGPSIEDSIGIGCGTGTSIGAGTIDPALLLNFGVEGQSNKLKTIIAPSNHDLDPVKELEIMLNKLPPEQRGELSKTIAKLVDQAGKSSDGQNTSVKPVPKTTAKKKADVQKTFHCPYIKEKKGEYETTWIQCPKTFISASELRKHRKRHDKNFGCTFDECYSKFGTKWEWKRHEQNQHLQNEAWRCCYNDGVPECQKLFSDLKVFGEHLVEHFDKSKKNVTSEEFANKVEECHLPQKWLGSYWCGFCRRIVRSEKKFGRDMDDERVEHIADHVHQDFKSSDWVELAAGGLTKGQMKVLKDASSKSESLSSRTPSSRRPSRQETEEEEGEGDDSDGSEAAYVDNSDSRAEPQQPTPARPSLSVITAQNSSGQPSPQGSRTEPLPTTPKIQLLTPEGVIVNDHELDAVNARPVRQQRAHTDNNLAGYKQQHHQPQQRYLNHQHYQAQPHTHSQSPSQLQQSPSLPCCCLCRRHHPWGSWQGKCEYQDCEHECSDFCYFPMGMP